LGVPLVRALAGSAKLLELVQPHARPAARAVRAIYFDKSAEANWMVSWHQDVTIAVRERRDVAGFGPWSVKESVPHVTAPAELLEHMLTVRLHLDDADEENGALRVLAGSHRFGRVSDERIDELVQELPEVVCRASAGDALLMRPLLLHASGRSASTRRRRVLHLEYAGFDLPGGLQWHEAS
jgi:ectoine hydroxylase-related dioxygenase (phytanoyl-CoA dioxygenase family)